MGFLRENQSMTGAEEARAGDGIEGLDPLGTCWGGAKEQTDKDTECRRETGDSSSKPER